MMLDITPHGRRVVLGGQAYSLRLTLAALAEMSRILEAPGPQGLAQLWRSTRDEQTIKMARILLAAMLRPSMPGHADTLSERATTVELNKATHIIADLFEEAFAHV